MKRYRVVQHTDERGETYFTVERRFMLLFWDLVFVHNQRDAAIDRAERLTAALPSKVAWP